MGYISNQWLKGEDAQRIRGHIPVLVAIEAIEITDDFDSRNEVKVLLRATRQYESASDLQFVRLTKEEVGQALPYFLRESDLTDLPLGDPKRVAIVTALSKLNETELNSLLSDIKAAQVEPEPLSRLNVASFAEELGLPCTLLLEQLQAAGAGKMNESDSITEQDKAQLLEHLRQANNASSVAKGEHNKKEIPAANITDTQERQLMTDAVKLGKLVRAQKMLEARQGKRTLDFVEIRKLDMDIEQIEKELERSEK
jgi:hypothetical protein